MSHTNYFAYGSNLNPARLEKRLGIGREARLAKLNGYRFEFNKIRDDGSRAANLMLDSVQVVWGAIYSCTEEEMQILDKFEGVAVDHYRRTELSVELSNGATEQVITYIAQPHIVCDEGEPNKDYLNHVLSGLEFHRAPASYIETVRIASVLP